MQSVGIDIVLSSRIERIYERFGDRFPLRLLGAQELAAFRKRVDKIAFLAGRFAVKEALIKALGPYVHVRPAYHALQVVTSPTGQPQVAWPEQLTGALSHLHCAVSISHERHAAVAIAILSERR